MEQHAIREIFTSEKGEGSGGGGKRDRERENNNEKKDQTLDREIWTVKGHSHRLSFMLLFPQDLFPMAWSRIAHREPRENNRETDRFLCACILWSRYNITLVCIGEQREQWRSPTGSVNILPLSSAKGGSWLLHTPHSGGYNNRKTRRYTFFRFAKNFLRSLNARRTKKRNK